MLMGELDRCTDRREEPQAGGDIQASLVAILVNRFALDVVPRNIELTGLGHFGFE